MNIDRRKGDTCYNSTKGRLKVGCAMAYKFVDAGLEFSLVLSVKGG